jgi:D-arabinose 1-dehydrogenase-like Zn-dependent alcohol dehydrogenase
MIKIYFAILLMGLLGGAGYGAYYYYKDTQARIQILTENSAKLEAAKMAQDNTIKTLKEDAGKYQKLNKDLSLQLQKSNDYKNKLIGKLRKHNLTRLSQQKPNLVEGKINRGIPSFPESFESDSALPAVK